MADQGYRHSDGRPESLAPHAHDAKAVLEYFESSTESGLRTDQVALRRDTFGFNVLKESPAPSRWRKILRQFASLLVGILIVAALVSALMGEWTEAVAISVIVLLNGFIGFLQEERAERALAALRNMAAPLCRVTRDGREQTLAAADLVPGDLIHVEAGDQVPADTRLWQALQLRTEEAALTGESAPVGKNASAVFPPDAALGDRRNMVFAGTSVVAGKGQGVVIATGMHTELGRIAGMLESTVHEPTPLQHRLSVLGRYLAAACLLLVAAIFLLNIARGQDPLEVFLYSVSLAVAAVPEGLPAVVTVALALGVHRMARRQALVRRLPAVETLGCVTIICSDKTGTLTRNEMTVREIWTPEKRFHVTGAGYAAEGEIQPANDSQTEAAPADAQERDHDDVDLRRAIAIGALCNNAHLDHGSDGAVKILGDPTEAALLVLTRKARMGALRHERTHEIPFDSARKAMSVVIREPDSGAALYSKGATETILSKCTHIQRRGVRLPLLPHDAKTVRRAALDMGHRALRVLALAFRPVAEDARPTDESGLTFVALVGMMDPPREEARAAVQRCRDAGIRVAMITGDQGETALAIARDLDMVSAQSTVLTGAALDELTDEALTKEVDGVHVFARVSAEHKLRIVRALRGRSQVVAMTGDGVNDAPAIKAADIGVAMGRTGTDVTRSASDMVLLDDNFATIVAAVEEGRGIFDNIQKVTQYLLSCNAGELMLLFFAALAGWPNPLLAVQILWINLITDGVPALALSREPPDRDIMNRPPRRPAEPLLSAKEGLGILGNGLLMAAMAAAGFYWFMNVKSAPLDVARSAAFSTMAFTQLFFAVGSRSRRYTMPEIGWFSNPALFWAIALSALLQIGVTLFPLTRSLLKTEPLTLHEWAIVVGLALIPVTCVEVWKLVRGVKRHTTSARRA